MQEPCRPGEKEIIYSQYRKEKKPCQSRILNWQDCPLKIEVILRLSQLNKKLREFVTTRPTLQEKFKGALQVEMNKH